uniref:Uncharacterized protein n=1 Tax=Oryza punctata TaxID=4537 RepID=A0A0E0LU54_ORYPU
MNLRTQCTGSQLAKRAKVDSADTADAAELPAGTSEATAPDSDAPANDAVEDHPKKLCVWPLPGEWRRANFKVVATKELPRVKYSDFQGRCKCP